MEKSTRPKDKELQVHAGDYVEAGDPLIRGPIIPHDILRIKGEDRCTSTCSTSARTSTGRRV